VSLSSVKPDPAAVERLKAATAKRVAKPSLEQCQARIAELEGQLRVLTEEHAMLRDMAAGWKQLAEEHLRRAAAEQGKPLTAKRHA
jgi:peptidoglycan hydrolase CwlO-like protein